MGGSRWDDDHYTAKNLHKSSRGVATFDYDAANVKHKGTSAYKPHANLDPKGVTRESRDSDAHPNSVAIAILFDVTGSMGAVPIALQKKLPQLMGLLLRKNYVQDPQILFGAIGDWTCDQVPLQVGQFESGTEMDDDVTRILLEGGGGGQIHESYQDALYFAAKHTSIDCFEKRGKKGYLFIIGDEMPYAAATKKEIEEIFGDKIEADIPIKELVDSVKEKYHLFYIMPNGSGYFDTATGSGKEIKQAWVKLLGGEHFIKLEDLEAVCETIGATIGLIEGSIDGDGLAHDLKSAGVDTHVATLVSAAVDPLAKSTALAKAGTGNLPEKADKPSTNVRL